MRAGTTPEILKSLSYPRLPFWREDLRRFTISTLEIPPFLLTAVYVGSLLIAMLIYKLTKSLGGGHMVLSMHQLEMNGNVMAGLGKVWFIFAWALFAPLAFALLGHRAVSDDPRGVQFVKGLWASLNAGVFEELIYRVYGFLAAMVIEHWMNFFGIEQWFVTKIEWPLANFLTLNAFHRQVAAHPQWAFVGALVLAGMWFSKGHEHLGWVAQINSWFLGMVMFYLVLNYGLMTAIAAHVLYDVIVFTVYSVTSEKQYVLPGWLNDAFMQNIRREYARRVR